MTRRSESNVVKFKKPRFSIGGVIFSLILLYVLFYSVSFFNKDHITIYEVNEKQISDNSTTVGIAVRTEEIYNAPASGFVNFYNSKGTKVAKGAIAFAIDPDGSMNNYLADFENNSDITSYDVKTIQSDISNFKSSFDFSDYSSVYDFKYNVENDVLSYISSISYAQLTNDINDPSFTLTKTNESGVIAYWTDSMEGITADKITSSSFDEDNYSKTVLKTSDNVSQGDPVCKVITSEDWSIVIKLSDDQYAKLENDKTVMVKFSKDGLKLKLPFRLFSAGGENFAELFLTDYMSRYIDDRFINIELLLNSAEGLKIPVSSLVDKSCYIVPISFLEKGSDTGVDELTYQVAGENNTIVTKNITTFAMVDEDYVYIDAVMLQPGTTMQKPGTEETYQLAEMKTLRGVYNVNKGYCQFKQVDILYENKEYCIVRNHTDYGLQVYDHIVVNPELIDEDDIIYK